MSSSGNSPLQAMGSASTLAVTIDLDWATEVAIEETLAFLRERRIPATIFTTHRSACIDASLHEFEVGLHPYFDQDSSHGRTIEAVVQHVMELPHNLPAFRCHRFGISNEVREALCRAGLKISSNVCTDLEIVAPFYDRFKLLEIPIFLEDGGYLYQRHEMAVDHHLEWALCAPGAKVVLLHPMHFSINTPGFDYMAQIKRSVSREAWRDMTVARLEALRWRGTGIRDFTVELLDRAHQMGVTFTTLGEIARGHAARTRGGGMERYTSILSSRA